MNFQHAGPDEILMRYSLSIWDALFGEKLIIQLPRANGSVRRRKVSRRWFEAMELLGCFMAVKDEEIRTVNQQSSTQSSSGTETIKSAQMLVASAKVFVIGSNTALCNVFPILAPIDCEDWDFFGTVAAVWSAAFGIEHLVAEDLQGDVWKIVEDDLAEWHPSALDAMNDLSEFVGKSCAGTTDAAEAVPHAVGMWMLWNLLDRKPDQDEYEIAGAFGAAYSHQFLHYWSR